MLLAAQPPVTMTNPIVNLRSPSSPWTGVFIFEIATQPTTKQSIPMYNDPPNQDPIHV